MNYAEALDYIHKISWTGSRPGLERISELAALLGDPQDKLKFIHVGGTNGKGSFCSMLSSVLIKSGMKVGIYTSPYIYRFNERISINGEPISDEALARLTERVKAAADKMADPPTEFELITALGFLYFAEEKCDIVVLEVGLGGRL
ncbi:MAG: bifunctional folylpolyglutamate synthase/dihydrofolate synthase, partial [Clostridia bacterium]|nr:bifunctional folylpolyglutamate synthase/dihydrofolate synthase [Clostridia bacterium]